VPYAWPSSGNLSKVTIGDVGWSSPAPVMRVPTSSGASGAVGTRWRSSPSAAPRAVGGGAGAGAGGRGVRRARASPGLDAVARVVLLEVEQAACTKGIMTMELE
jgi:hypothetical protein